MLKTIFLRVVFSKIQMIRLVAVVNYMIPKFSFCSHFYGDVLENINILHIFVDLKTVFISWNMMLKLNSFNQIGIFKFWKKLLTLPVVDDFLDETICCTSIYHLVTQIWMLNTQKYSLRESILLTQTKEYTLLYIPDKFQGIWMTKFFRMSVFYISLKYCFEQPTLCHTSSKFINNISISTVRSSSIFSF